MREPIVTQNVYHVLNRGVDKRVIFLEQEDYFRFVHNLFEFNDVEPAENAGYFFNSKNSKDVANPYIIKPKRKKRKLLVEILAFCLMPNHYHMMLRPKLDNSLPLFMKKLNTGYANYFNQKNKRAGALFEGRYKAIEINQESHFIHLPYYIHLNPLDLVAPEWRQGKLNNYQGAIEFLEQYRWSSFLDYIGKHNFPSVTQREFLSELFDGSAEYKKSTFKWLKDLDMSNLNESTLE